ncbi:ROK family protein [Salinicoccus jeotgali]|uniref:ROK family protein n=1 Tax=Salinicoccus jeotgali TaxID=381634 RepID=A0ABP7F5D1_9STAP
MITAFDIGGTSIKFGIVDQEGKILFKSSFPSDIHIGGERIIRKIIQQIGLLEKDWQIEGVAVSTAGQIDSHEGMVVHATDNIPNYTGLEIKSMIERETGLPAEVENDVNCTALGEYWKGAARDSNDFLCLTLGTGIGGALFLNGSLYTGDTFGAGEIGHMSLYPGGRPCTCGNSGCYEQYASTSALQRSVDELFKEETDLRHFFEKVRESDIGSLEVFHKWVEDLATGLQSTVHVLNPSLIVVGGGISEQGDLLIQQIIKSVEPKIMPNHRRRLEIVAAEHGNDANLIGAAKHFFDSKHIRK